MVTKGVRGDNRGGQVFTMMHRDCWKGCDIDNILVQSCDHATVELFHFSKSTYQRLCTGATDNRRNPVCSEAK